MKWIRALCDLGFIIANLSENRNLQNLHYAVKLLCGIMNQIHQKVRKKECNLI